MKKLLKFLVAIVFVTLLSANVFAYDFVVDGIYYNINSDGTTVSVTPENTDYNSYSGDITIPSTVTYNSTTYIVTGIGYFAFSYCPNLTSVSIPNTVASIGGSAFRSCTGLTSVTIPNSVVGIGRAAFSGCTGLKLVSIGNSVTGIGSDAFSDCTGLTSIICKAFYPPVLEYDVFLGVDKSIEFHIPCGTTSSYQAVSGWNEFTNMIEDNDDIMLNEKIAINNTELPYSYHGQVFFDYGTYTVSETTDNDCTIIYTLNLVHNLGIDAIDKENTILIYPNPAKENITLTADEDIFIFNNLGQIVKQINNPRGETTISVSDLQKGVYYIKTGNKTQKLIKE